MKRYFDGATVSLSSFSDRKWLIYILVLAVFSCGLLLGSVSSNNLDKTKYLELNQYINDFLVRANDISFEPAKMARNAAINNMITVAAIYFLGLTVIGLPIVLGVLFVRGFVIGFAVCFLTRDMPVSGLLFTLAAIFPHNLIYIPAICVGSASSIMFTVLLWKRNFNSGITIWPRLIKYTGIMAAVFVVALGAGLVEGYITPVFTKMAAAFISGRYLR